MIPIVCTSTILSSFNQARAQMNNINFFTTREPLNNVRTKDKQES